MTEAIPTTRDAYDLLHQGTLVLNRIQRNGMALDVPYLEHQARVLSRKQTKTEAAFLATDVGRLWRRRYGSAMALSKDQQLAQILFKEMGLDSTRKTASGGNSTTRGALEELKVPGLELLVEWRKLEKTLGTYVLGLLKEQVGGVLRPFFHLHTVRTFRGSSSDFNFQNLPNRDPEQGKAVRQAIIPWPGERIAEGDYGGLEVRIAACYHQDPIMLKYLNGQGDMHRDAACDLFFLSADQVTKEIRFRAKSSWVFAQFYGSWYEPCAQAIWMHIGQENLSLANGTPLRDHLRKNGIRTCKDYEGHCKDVEDIMWNKRFCVYRDWRKDWVRQYEKRGYIDLKTGFRCRGTMARNDVINYGVQGAAFHCLLWSLIQLDRAIQQEGWATRAMGQIHDSIVMSLPPTESDPVLDRLFQISERDIRDAWKWIIVPLEVEAEAGEVDGSWYGKRGVKKELCANGHKYHRKHKDGLQCLTCDKESAPF